MSLKHSGRNLVFGKIGDGFMEFIKFKLIFEKLKKNYWRSGYFCKNNFVEKVNIVCLSWNFTNSCLWFYFLPFSLGPCSWALALFFFSSSVSSSPQVSKIRLLLSTKNYIVKGHQWPTVYQSKWRGFLSNFSHWPVLSLSVSLKKIIFLLMIVIYMTSVESFENIDINKNICNNIVKILQLSPSSAVLLSAVWITFVNCGPKILSRKFQK